MLCVMKMDLLPELSRRYNSIFMLIVTFPLKNSFCSFQPVLPEGPSHKLSANYYLTRDARREVQPPIDCKVAALPAGKEEAVSRKAATPGRPYPWDHHY